MQYKELYLNSMTKCAMKRINVVASDSARSLRCFTDLDLSTIESARIYINKPDNTEVYADCDVHADKGYIDAHLTSQALSAAGTAYARLHCEDVDGYITTYDFIIEVLENAVSSSAIQSSNEYSALESLISTGSGDHISEQDSGYRKWDSGVLEEWGSIDFDTLEPDQPTSQLVTFQNEFIDTDYTVSISTTLNSPWIIAGCSTYDGTSGKSVGGMYVAANNISDGSLRTSVDWKVIGMWK